MNGTNILFGIAVLVMVGLVLANKAIPQLITFAAVQTGSSFNALEGR